MLTVSGKAGDSSMEGRMQRESVSRGRSVRCALALGPVLAAGLAWANTVRYEVVALPEPANATASGATSLSDDGWVAGWADGPAGQSIWRRAPDGRLDVLLTGVTADTTSVAGDDSLNIVVNSSGMVAASWFVGGRRVGMVFGWPGTDQPIVGFEDIDVGGLSDNGSIAGSARVSTLERRGLIGLPTALTAVPALGPSGGVLGVQFNDVNASLVAVGGSTHPLTALRPVVFADGRLTMLNMPGGYTAGVAEGVSASGAMVGRVLRPANGPVQQWAAVVWSGGAGGGTPSVVPTLSWTPPEGYIRTALVKPTRINEKRQAVGHVRYVRPIPSDAAGRPDLTDTSQSRGVLISGGRMTDLNTVLATNSASWRIVAATDIDEAGRITASARRAGAGPERAVLLMPVAPGGGGQPGPGTRPAKPPSPPLHPSTDLGVSPSDGVTSSRSLLFRGVFEAGMQMRLLLNGRELRGGVTFTNGRGEYQIRIPAPAAGRTEFRVVAVNRRGLRSEPSEPTFVATDFSAPPAPSEVGLATADLVGGVPGVRVPATRNPTPGIVGLGEPGNRVLLRMGSRTIGEATVGADRRFVVRGANPFRVGVQATVSLVQMDVAGNLSRVSAPVRFIVVR
jgi:uncharacterized membrane protein